MKEYWTQTSACIECGNMDHDAKAAYCSACGSVAGHKRVMIKVRETWFSAKIIDTRIVDGWRENSYLKRIAELLELQAYGEEVAYLADVMQTALTEKNQ